MVFDAPGDILNLNGQKAKDTQMQSSEALVIEMSECCLRERAGIQNLKAESES
jgi:hypothetical protein